MGSEVAVAVETVPRRLAGGTGENERCRRAERDASKALRFELVARAESHDDVSCLHDRRLRGVDREATDV